MKIQLHNIKVFEVVEGYHDNAEEGVRGYGGKLNIRPAYQREFIYKEKQRNEVIHTVRKNFPLNTMYWVVAGDGYELMDGQRHVYEAEMKTRERTPGQPGHEASPEDLEPEELQAEELS